MTLPRDPGLARKLHFACKPLTACAIRIERLPILSSEGRQGHCSIVMGLSVLPLSLPNRKMLFHFMEQKLLRYRLGDSGAWSRDVRSQGAKQTCAAIAAPVRPSNLVNAGMAPAAGAHPSPSSASSTFGGDIGRL